MRAVRVVGADLTNVQMPHGLPAKTGDIVVLTEEEFAQLRPELFGDILTEELPLVSTLVGNGLQLVGGSWDEAGSLVRWTSAPFDLSDDGGLTEVFTHRFSTLDLELVSVQAVLLAGVDDGEEGVFGFGIDDGSLTGVTGGVITIDDTEDAGWGDAVAGTAVTAENVLETGDIFAFSYTPDSEDPPTEGLVVLEALFQLA